MKVAFFALALSLVPDSSGPVRTAEIDLLKIIDPLKDRVAGGWGFKEGKLTTPGKPFDRLQIPYAPPAEYDVTVVAERRGGTNSLNLGMAVGETQFLVILDGLIGREYSSGLDLVDGKPFYANETTFKGALFADGKPGKVVCSVRNGAITVAVDGRKVVDWKADLSRLSIFPGWKVPQKSALLLGSWTSEVRFHQIALRPVSGRGKALRP
jgi:hypothetical protein